MAGMPSVTVGIVTWNSEKVLPACLQGVAAQKYPAVEIVVVDNGSIDGSLRLIREAFPQSRIITNDGNLGYCVAHNQGIRASRGEYYLALNPDVELLPGFIERLVSALESRPACGSAVGKLWQRGQADPPLLDAAGLFLDRRRHQYLRGRGEPDRGYYDTAEEVFGADGAAPLHRRAMLEDVKVDGEYFDEQYFVYMEDVDLAWRARLRGWGCWYEPSALAFHVRTFRPGRRSTMARPIRRMAVKNRYLTILKNEGREEWRRDWWRILSYDLGIWAYIVLFEQSSLGALALLRRQWDRALAWRGEIRRRARAEPSVRLAWFQ
jgi:GT2 family glycosyltransferase